MQKKNLVLAISLALTTGAAFAQDNSAELETVEVVDTAFQDQVRSITSEKLENMQATDIKDILKTMPSVIVDGASRYSQMVYVRGLEDKFANITIDGARMTGQLFHHSGDQTIDAEMLKISEVELGPNSALSGPGVVNGSFVYETKDPSDMLEDGETFGGKIGIGYQSGFDRRMGNLSVYGAPGEVFEYLLSGNIVDDKTIKTPLGEDTSKQSKLTSGLAKIVIKPTDDSRFALTYNTYDDGGNRQLAANKPDSESDSYNYNAITRDTLSGNFEYNPNDMVDLSLKVYSNKQKLERDGYSGTYNISRGVVDGNATYPGITYENASKGVDLRNSSILNDSNVLTYGIEYSRDSQDKDSDGVIEYLTGTQAGTTENTAFTGRSYLDHYGVYVEDEINLDQWKFNLGARFDKYELGGIFDGDFSQFSPKAKVSFQATDDLALRMGYGRIFRGPQLGETLFLEDGLVQSENTNASSGHNIEVGFDYDLSDTLGADRSLLGFTAYRYELDNYTHPAHNAELSPQGDMEVWGLETVFTLHKGNLNLNLSHTYTDGKATDYDDGSEFEPTTAHIHTFKIDTDYRINDQWSLNYNGQFVPGNSYKSSNGDVDRAGYGVHNIGATYEPSALKGAKINIGVDNVFDKAYTRHTAFGTSFGNSDWAAYEVGRNFKIDFSYKF